MRLPSLLLSSSLLLAAVAARAEAPQALAETAWAQPKSTIQADFRETLAIDAAASVRFPAIDGARITAVKIDNAAPGRKALVIGVERELAESKRSAVTPAWRNAADGGLVAQFETTSPGAVALRSAFDFAGLPEGAQVRVKGSDGAIAVGGAEIAVQRASQPRWWSPVTQGDTQQIEVWLPAGSDPQWVSARFEAVSHLFVSPNGDLKDAKIGESDDCEFDAKCLTNPSNAILQAKNAVARMAFQKNGQTGLCTGTLLNDTDTSTQVPQFYSAAHCFTSQSIASTLVTFWFYEATACGSGSLDAAARQVTGGSVLEFASDASDVLLVKLNSAPPQGSTFLGWNAATVSSGANIAVLHHPAGDVKKVSLGNVKGFGGSTLASGQFIKVGYTDGTTEGGSSGCGLLISNGTEYQLRGGLLGGSASCANTGDIANGQNSDDFSRFDQAFPQLQAFLQPSGNPTGPTTNDFTGIYNNPQQSGWGLAIVRGGSGTHAVNIYHYGQDNQSAWFLSTGTFNNGNYSTNVIATAGPWFGTTPYDPAGVTVRTAGTITLQFIDNTTANLSFTIDGRTVTTQVRKLSF